MKVGIAIWFVVVAAYADSAWAAKAVCVVCALGGEVKEEKVAATRRLDGVELSFCSAKCAAEFDQDPYAYVFVSGPAPEMTFVSLAGDTIRTAGLRGKIVLIDFWATWCKPCVESMPDLDALQKQHGGELVVVGVSVDRGSDREKKVRKFLEKHPVGYPIVVDADQHAAWERLRVKVLPTLYLVAPDGTVVSRHAGPLRLAELEQEIAALLQDRSD
jgi:thiol-disulfide isomerase/thioredoxin